MATSGSSGVKVSTTAITMWLNDVYQSRKVPKPLSWDSHSTAGGDAEHSYEWKGWEEGNIIGLAKLTGMSVRRFSDHFKYEDGRIVAKSDSIDLYRVDEILTSFGSETLANLYPADEQPEPVFPSYLPKCRSCKIELRERTGGICGFCLERI